MSFSMDMKNDEYPEEWGSNSPFDWREEYIERKEIYEKYCQRLKLLLQDLLENAGIKFHLVEARVKSPDSFRCKIEKEPMKYREPFDNVKDIIGLRIILFYPSDIDQIHDLLKSEFEISEFKDYRQPDKPNIFDYESLHLIVSLTGERLKLMEWKEYEVLKSEIQIRTVLQHAWAAVSHALEYKSETEWPKGMKHRLKELMARLTAVDRDFDGLKTEAQELSEEYSRDILSGKLTIPIDAISLQEYIENSPVFNEISQKTVSAGIKLSGVSSACITAIVQIADMLEIKDIETLDNFFSNADPSLKGLLTRMFANMSNPKINKAALALFILSFGNRDSLIVKEPLLRNKLAWFPTFLNILPVILQKKRTT